MARAVVFAGIALLTSLCYLAIRTHYLPHGQGFRFPAARLIYPVGTPAALAPIWGQSNFSECFYARADGLATMQLQVYSYHDHVGPQRVNWTLEDLDQPGGAPAVRSGSFPARQMHDYGFIRLRFDPLRASAGRLYRLTLKAPDTAAGEAGAVTLFPSADPEASAAQRASGAPGISFSMMFDRTHEGEFSRIFFRHGTTVSQTFTPRQEFMTSLQIPLTVDGRPADYKVHWSLVRIEDGAEVGRGDLDASSVENWQFADLLLPLRERCSGRAYKLTLGPEEGGDERGSIGVSVYPLKGNAVTIASKSASAVKEGFSVRVIIMDSPVIKGLTFFYKPGSDVLSQAPDGSLYSNMTLWYFPSNPEK